MIENVIFDDVMIYDVMIYLQSKCIEKYQFELCLDSKYDRERHIRHIGTCA